MTDILNLNGVEVEIPGTPLLLIDFLRQSCHLTGTKAACREGDCGSCQVLLRKPGEAAFIAVVSCLIPVQHLAGCELLTIEAIPAPNPVQQTYAREGASQCGFCSPGLVMATIGWLLTGRTLSVEEGLTAINGNLCRCTGYMGQKRGVQYLQNRYSEALLACSNRVEYLVAEGILPAAVVKRTNDDAGSNNPPNVTDKWFGGGTDLLLEKSVVDVVQHYIPTVQNQPVLEHRENCLAISALHSLQAIDAALLDLEIFPALHQLTEQFASPPIRAMATFGGNLAHASPVGDSISFFMALDVVLETDRRSIPICQFYKGFKQTVLLPGEKILWICVPNEFLTDTIIFEKVARRNTTDIAVMNCAGRWKIQDDSITSVSLVLGGATVTPVRLIELEEKLEGLPLARDILSLVKGVSLPVDPITDVRGSACYRAELASQLMLSQWDRLRGLVYG